MVLGRNMSSHEDDLAIWQAVMKAVKPLKGREKARAPQKPAVKTGGRAMAAPMRSQSLARSQPPARPLHRVASKAGGGQAIVGADQHIASIDKLERHRRDQIKKDKLTIDGTIDLHGMTQDKAFVALERFCHRHVASQSRLILVVTGKGSVSEGGVLKKALPYWLRQILGARLLALDEAMPRHGGSGAFYVLIRRQRQ
jgi:DNA-nicking Smr family endonuclease